MNSATIYLFRHGQTTFNRDQKFTGWKDPKLTNLGFRQARTLAKKLRNKKFQLAFQTRLVRSKQTLNEVLKYHPECKKIVTDKRMIERNYGLLNGTSHNDFINMVGKRLCKLEVEGDFFTDLDKKAKKKIQKFLGKQEYDIIHRGYNIAPLGGESFADVEKRVSSFIKDLLKLMRKKKVSVAISAHGNSIRLFRKIMEHASPRKCTKWSIPYDDYYAYTIRL